MALGAPLFVTDVTCFQHSHKKRRSTKCFEATPHGHMQSMTQYCCSHAWWLSVACDSSPTLEAQRSIFILKNPKMPSTSRSLATILILASACVRSTFGFQSLLNKVSLLQKPEFTCHNTKLCAKFRLDNGMDDEDDLGSNRIPSSLRNIDLTEEDFENVERTNAPSTTFGAEAVPLEQRPANEYLGLISAPFFDWANRPGGDISLVVRLGVLYAVTFVAVCWPISGATFTMDGYLYHKILSSTVGGVGFILLFCLRLYSGWEYIGDRLTSKDIEFEETGW